MQWTGRNPCTCADKCRVTGTFTACAAIVLSGKISLMKICFILVIFVVLTVIFIPSNKINYTILTLLLILFRFHCMLVLTIYNIHILYREFQWGGESPEVLSSPPPLPIKMELRDDFYMVFDPCGIFSLKQLLQYSSLNI